MHILIVKTTSLGDLVHMLPALTEAVAVLPGLRADWVAEEGFTEIPAMHPAVDTVIPVAMRRWRGSLLARQVHSEWSGFVDTLRTKKYDLVLDSQGLIKSALLSFLARGPRAGLDFASAREPLASLSYNYRYTVPRELHAITRNRILAARALGYAEGGRESLRYGVSPSLDVVPIALPERFVLCLHGTARQEKEYPESDWGALIEHINDMGYPVVLPWGNDREHGRAERLASKCEAIVLPRLGLDGLFTVLGRAVGVVGVDTGLMHLAAAFHKPGIGLYPATPPERFGAWSEPDAPRIVNLSSSADLKPDEVARYLRNCLAG